MSMVLGTKKSNLGSQQWLRLHIWFIMILLYKMRQLLLQNVTAVISQNATKVYYKMHQDFYYKMRQFYDKMQQL